MEVIENKGANLQRSLRAGVKGGTPPGNSYGYQNKGVAERAVWNRLETKEIWKGKKGKVEKRKGTAERVEK